MNADVNRVITGLGGVDNIKVATICATRIKILPIDISKVDFLSLENENRNIIKVFFETGGYVHLIIGTRGVYHNSFAYFQMN